MMRTLNTEKYRLSADRAHIQFNHYEHSEAMNSLTNIPHTHMFYELELITDGVGTAFIGTDRFPISAGSTILIKPGDIHWYDCEPDTTLWLINLKFTADYLAEHIASHPRDFEISHIGRLEGGDFATLRELFQTLHELQQSESELCERYSEAIRGAAEFVCAIFARSVRVACENSVPGEPESVVSRVIYHINAYVTHDLTLSRVAEHFGYTPNYLGRIFFEETGVHYSEYVSRLRADIALYRIMQTDLPLKQIAKECGFGSFVQLSRAMKRYYGLSPGSVRG